MERRGFEWLIGIVLAAFFFSGCYGTRPSNLGVKNGRLSPCPPFPNCVCSQSEEQRHRIDPIRFTSGPAEARERIKKIVLGMKRTTLVRESLDYLHVERRTLLGFVDDMEFYVDGSQKIIHLRSASRVGRWDLGVNRRRMESIRTDFGKQ